MSATILIAGCIFVGIAGGIAGRKYFGNIQMYRPNFSALSTPLNFKFQEVAVDELTEQLIPDPPPSPPLTSTYPPASPNHITLQVNPEKKKSQPRDLKTPYFLEYPESITDYARLDDEINQNHKARGVQ
jgi:hypothetical protein